MPEVVFSVDQSKSMADQAVPGHNRWHPDIPPAATVQPGSEFRVECREWTDAQIHNNDSANDVRDAIAGIVDIGPSGSNVTLPVHVCLVVSIARSSQAARFRSWVCSSDAPSVPPSPGTGMSVIANQ